MLRRAAVWAAALAAVTADDNWLRTRWDPTTADPTVVCDSTADGSYSCYTCPRGKYRKAGLRRSECVHCPRGRYGATAGLTSSTCTANCPSGRYNDRLGAKSPDDCKLCPSGKYGAATGLATSECSSSCPSGYYSATFGLDSSSLCDECPVGYRGWQCTHALTPRRGHFISTDGHIDERSHAYVDGEKIPQGLSPVTWVDLASPLVNKATGPYDA